MVFKGTPTRTAADVNRELDEVGSHSNAYTSEEQTVYYATVLPEYQDRCVDLLADIMRPSLRNVDFDMEKQVILEEIAKYEDQPPFGAHEKCMAEFFGNHPLARSVLGTVESVSALTADQMKEYFRSRYSPSNIALCVSGNVDFDHFVALAEQHCGHWEPFEAPRTVVRAQAHTGFKIIPKETAMQQYVIQLAAGPAAEDSDRFASRLLSTILGDDSGSRMFWELVDTGLAEYAAMAPQEYQGTGVLATFLCCLPEEARRNLVRMKELFQDAVENGITEAELEQAKSKVCSHIILQSERPANRLFSLGGNWIQRGEYKTVRQSVDTYRAVTVEQVNAVAKKYPLTETTTVAVGPLNELELP